MESDLISRQAVIDELREAENHSFNGFYKGLVKAHKIIAKLPSVQSDNGYSDGFADGYKRGLTDAQSEIVRCKNCKDYQEGVDINGKPFSKCNGSVRTYGHTMPDWYCADAERREE